MAKFESPSGETPGPAKEAPTGTEAAARLNNRGPYPGSEGRIHRTRDFVDAIRAHQNTPAYLQALYKGLGDKEAEQLIKDASAQVAHRRTRGEDSSAAEQCAALKALAKSTRQLPPAVADTLAKAAGAQDSVNTLTAVLKQPEASEAMRRTFLDTASAAFDKSESFIDAQKVGDVLSSDPELIEDFAARWGDDKVARVLTKALSQPPLNPAQLNKQGTRQDGALKVLGQLAQLQGPRYRDLKTRVFRDAALLLGDDKAHPARKELVQGLTQLFKSDATDLIQRLSNDTSDPSHKALGTFLHAGLLDDSSKSEELESFISSTLIPPLRKETLDPKALGEVDGPASPD
ncbi:hypothetical protein NVS55_04135 [Myxococcus stipitatus]|uniref:hypothetical protein n=1 Tax=Myxococcus stipitatus TaxID=83455 RepID=UPI003144F003